MQLLNKYLKETADDPDKEMFNPILGVSAAQATTTVDSTDIGDEGLTAVNTIIEEPQETVEPPPIRTKKRRYNKTYNLLYSTEPL